MSTADEDRSELVDSCERALKLGLEYWRHRMQRFNNRHPAWVAEAEKALAAIQSAKADYSSPEAFGESLRAYAIASGAHEVHDRATHRAVSVETLRTLQHIARGSALGDFPDAVKALAEIEEALKP